MTVRVDKVKEFTATTQLTPCGPLGQAASRWSWQDAFAKASRDVEPNVYDTFCQDAKGVMTSLGCEGSSRQLSHEYSLWGRGMEIQSFTALGGDVASEAFKEVCGRTQAPVFREVPVRPNNRTTPMSRLALVGLDTLIAWLATIASMIGKLAQQARRKNVASVKDWQVHLVQTIAQPSNGLVRE